jgi:hypothetical protein
MLRSVPYLKKIAWMTIKSKILIFLMLQSCLIPMIYGGNSNEVHLMVNKNEINLLGGDGRLLMKRSLENEVIFDYVYDDITGYLYCILGKGGDKLGSRIAVYRLLAKEIRDVYYGDEKYNPWKILLADVEGDRQQDVCVAVWEKTIFDLKYDNRLFIYDWEDERLLPKWLGSRLSSPFTDFDFFDIDEDGMDELIALEIQRNGLRRVMSYKWQSFGFVGFKVLYEDQTANDLSEINFKKELIK